MKSSAMADPQAEDLPVAGRRQGRENPARPPRAQEPADLRILRRAARPLSRPRLCRRCRRGRVPAERRQFLLGRRRARHHRPAGQDGHEGAARLHAHDRRFRQGDAQLRQADHLGGRRRGGRRRRDHRHGLRHPHRHAGGEDRVPVHPRRARRLRHGRLRDPAAHHRPGPRGGAALHRPHDERGRGRALGVLQPAGRGGCAGGRRDGALPRRIVSGPTFAHGITKTQLNQEWSMGLDQAIEAEAQAQAICMQTKDFERAYKAFVAKEKPVFEGD